MHQSIRCNKIRKELQTRKYQKWCALPHKRKGVALFEEYKSANKWIRNHAGLSVNQWHEGIKMIANVCSVQSISGRSLNGNLCRQCRRETETLAHVLGSCPHGELLRNTRHHKIRSLIANQFKKRDYHVVEEVIGIATNGSIRRIDILAYRDPRDIGYIIDPTVRFENSSGQPDEVDKEKKLIYEPTIPYYLEKYKLKAIQVMGLMIGA